MIKLKDLLNESLVSGGVVSGGSDAGSGPACNSAGGSGIVVISYKFK